MAIIFERHGPVATITLNRPEKMNALDPATYEEITQAFTDIERDRDVLVGIITGAGDRAFTAGADLKLMHTGDGGDGADSGDGGDGGAGDEWAPWRADRWDFGLTTTKPLIAAVNGYALAGGLELALICDIRIASPNATFGTPEVKWNLLHGFGAYRLPRIIGLSYAMELLLTGEFIDAETALRIGLISRIVPADELLPEAERLAARIAANGPMAVRMTKELVLNGLTASPDQHFRLMKEYYARVDATADQAEGLQAFRERRSPNYQDHS